MSDTHTNLLYHVVFSTKHRAPIITERIREPLSEYIGGIVRAEGEFIELLELNDIDYDERYIWD